MGQFAQCVQGARSKKFKSAKAFWATGTVPCSYAQYTLIEKGADLPQPTLAAQIAKSLNLDLKAAMYAWAADSMPSHELKEIFRHSKGDEPLPDVIESKALASIEPPLVINRMQASLLLEKPRLYEILTYMTVYAAKNPHITKEEIAATFAISQSESNADLRTLYNFGLVDQIDENSYKAKMNITIPNEIDLDPLQFQIFRKAIESFDVAVSSGARPLRATLTRLLTPEQYTLVEHRFRALRNWVWTLPDIGSEESKPHMIAIFGAERTFL